MGKWVKVAFADKLSSTLDARFEAYIVDHAPPPSCRIIYNFIIMILRLLASAIQLFNLTAHIVIGNTLYLFYTLSRNIANCLSVEHVLLIYTYI